jgi:hypothetical protein
MLFQDKAERSDLIAHSEDNDLPEPGGNFGPELLSTIAS